MEINDKIVLKQKEIDLQDNSVRKRELQNDLRVLQLRKDIEDIKKKIEQIKN